MVFFGLTDAGKQRSDNQDNFKICQLECGAVLAVVCDGMGGAAGGSIASSIAAETFCNIIIQNEKLLFSPDGAIKENTVKNALITGVNKANTAVYQKAVIDPSLEGMGTTLVGCFIYKDIVMAINVGDSRIYSVYKDRVVRVSKDHSFVQTLVDMGEISEKEAQNHPKKNIIMRAVGVDDSVEADYFRLSTDMEQILLCSDGLSNYVTDDNKLLEFFVEQNAKNAAESLVEFANKSGGGDNITAVVIDFKGGKAE